MTSPNSIGYATNPQPKDDPRETLMEYLEPRINEIIQNFREHMSEARIKAYQRSWTAEDRERAIAEIAESIAQEEHLAWA